MEEDRKIKEIFFLRCAIANIFPVQIYPLFVI